MLGIDDIGFNELNTVIGKWDMYMACAGNNHDALVK